MRVLWFSCTPSCYDVKTMGGWIESLEIVVKKYLPEIDLGIVFEHTDDIFKSVKQGVTYYPIRKKSSIYSKVKNRLWTRARRDFDDLKPQYLRAINDFKPDIIQCFGTELWHYSLLQKEVNIPFVIHIMGFWNIYNIMGEIAQSPSTILSKLNLVKWIRDTREKANSKEHCLLEQESMRICNYYMGRTNWDKAIVSNFSPKAKYYYCPEAIREQIYEGDKHWTFNKSDIIRLITISNAGNLKGNDIILRTAWILTKVFKQKIEWIYTTSPKSLRKYEALTKINSNDVGLKVIGRVRSDEIPNLLSQAEFFVHPSIIDNSPNSICEAQLFGIPVIASNCGGVPQLVEDNVTGFLYPYSEPYALAFKILELHNQEGLLNVVSINSRSLAKKRHDPLKIADVLLRIYKDIINNQESIT